MCVRACVNLCACACVRARACVRACVCVCVCSRIHMKRNNYNIIYCYSKYVTFYLRSFSFKTTYTMTVTLNDDCNCDGFYISRDLDTVMLISE